MSTILADYEQRKGQALFIHSILRVGYALWRPARASLNKRKLTLLGVRSTQNLSHKN